MFGAQRQDPHRSPRIGSPEDAQESPAAARLTERDLVGRRLQELYAFNRGALYSNSLIQAQAAFEQGDFAKTLELVKASSELFEKRHKRALQQDPRKPDGKKSASRAERLALESKQSRIKEILGIFEEVLKPLETMAKFQRLGRPRPTAHPLPQGFQAEYEAAQTPDARYQVLRRYFDVEPVGCDQDLRPDTLYYVRGKESHLIRSAEEESRTDPVAMTVVPSSQRMKPVPRQRLLELGRTAQLVKLVPKAAGEAVLSARSAQGEPDSAPGSGKASPEPMKSYAQCIIDMGSFTQLLTAAQQSEIVPQADQIAHVRDREFRMGKYQTAFDIIERMSVRFSQAAAGRQQKLRREELDYRSGVLKMSPKQWQLKKQRDTLQTQKIERARKHFARVLDGLRVLMVSE